MTISSGIFFDRGQYFVVVEWLLDEVVKTQFSKFLGGVISDVSADRYYRKFAFDRIGQISNVLQAFHSIHHGHADVHQDEVKVLFFQQFEYLLSISRSFHLVILKSQDIFGQIDNDGTVFSDKDFFLRHSWFKNSFLF